MSTKITQISVTVPPRLKEQIWKESARLHTTPSVWIRQIFTWGLERSQATPTPTEYILNITQKQAYVLYQQGFRIECKPIEDED